MTDSFFFPNNKAVFVDEKLMRQSQSTIMKIKGGETPNATDASTTPKVEEPRADEWRRGKRDVRFLKHSNQNKV